ncbi:MAG: YceI family protein [Puniceicoccaceae bacterium]
MLPEPGTVKEVSASQLIQEKAAGSQPIVIDVRINESFTSEHILGADNICVYEVTFADKVREKYPDQQVRLVLYGQDAHFKASLAAYARLTEAGYSNLNVLGGGLDGWKNAGGETVAGKTPAVTPPEEELALNPDDSKLRWIGRNLSNQHNGEIGFKEGKINLATDGQPTSGSVTVDMTSMTCHDIEDSNLASYLVAHLSNADFFLVEKYPTASISIDKFTPVSNATPGSPNYSASGTITVRGVNQQIELDALVEQLSDGRTVFQAEFSLDRTRHGAIYGSGRFFERLGMHLVNDLVHIQVMAFFGEQETA